MRAQQVVAVGEAAGYLPPDHYAQIFTAHGIIMIFFVAMPFMFGLLNFAVPLQIGSRDVAYPFLNSMSFWLTVAGAALINLSLVVGEFAATGWLAYPPLSELQYSPGVGVDYYIWALQIAGVGTLISGINFLVTIIKMRAPGMSLMRMPIFVWTALGSMILVIFAFPILTVTLGLLSLDRILGMHFFTTDLGGSAMMYVNLIWAWGHPEVYILILPAFGIFSEIVPVFSRKKLFGYTSMVVATLLIVFLSFIVWVHHFFTMGAGANVNAFFGIMTMAIAIPTGVKVFNWLFTMFRGRITFATPMLWFMGFLTTFILGGMTGVLDGDTGSGLSAPQQFVFGRALSQHDNRRGTLRVFCRVCVLVPQGDGLYAQRAAGQVCILELDHRISSCLYSALRAWAYGYDAAFEPSRPNVPAASHCRGSSARALSRSACSSKYSSLWSASSSAKKMLRVQTRGMAERSNGPPPRLHRTTILQSLRTCMAATHFGWRRKRVRRKKRVGLGLAPRSALFFRCTSVLFPSRPAR